MPAQMKTYQQVFQTPAEQKILMTDGTGAGLTALLASFNPGLKLLQGFWPGDSLPGLDFEKSANLEGNIELTDKYGFYSIKGSTNDRNVSIKSPWGDVKIDAFTGITISAPNGDVKIKGKNVSIEAGGNLTLTSGKNIKQRWYMDGEDADAVTLASTITKTVTSKAASLLVNITDLSLIRHIIEVIFKPVEGKVQITAGRYMMLESGGKKAGYPIDAYKQKKMDDYRDAPFGDLVCCKSFEKLKEQVDYNYSRLGSVYNDARQRKEALATLINECKNDKGEAQCKGLDEIINALWDDPTKAKKEIFEFKGIYRDVKEDDDIDEDIIKNFLPALGMIAQRRMEDPNFRRRRWQDAISQQTIKKDAMVKAVKKLALMIKVLKTFDVSPQQLPAAYDKLRSVVMNNKLPDDCLFLTLKDKDEYKQFNAEFQVSADETKKVFRKLVIALVNAFEIPRSATESDGIGMKATVFPEPQPDCSDADWTKYCNSIQTLRKKESKSTWDKVSDKIASNIVDPLKGMFDIKGFMAFNDDCSFGSSKKGEILFASGDGTMVLDRGIYRANVGGWENYDDGMDRPAGNGFVTRVRNVMLSL